MELQHADNIFTENSQQFNEIRDGNRSDLTIDMAVSKQKQKEKNLGWGQILLNILIHLILFGFTAYISFICFINNIVLFTWHPFLMSFGIIIFMAEAILTFSDNNLITRKLKFKNQVLCHWILQAIGGCLTIAGFIIIVVNKNINDKRHFKSWHGIFGLSVVICISLSIIGGIFARYSFDLRQYVRPVYAKILHTLFSVITFVLGFVTTILALYSHWFDKFGSFIGRNVCFGLLIIAIIYILIKPITLIIARIKTAFMRASL